MTGRDPVGVVALGLRSGVYQVVNLDQLDRIEKMLVRLTHHLVIRNGVSGEYSCECSCGGWKGQGWRWTGPGSGASRIGPEAEFEGHLAALVPVETSYPQPEDPETPR